MSAKSVKETFKNPEQRRYMTGDKTFTAADSGSGILAGQLVEKSGATLKTGTEQSALILGVSKAPVAASAQCTAEHGFVNVLTASPVSKLDLLAPRENGKAGAYMASQVTLVSAKAGGNFGNQPAGDGVEIVSADTGDTTQVVTVYGTITGSTDTVTSEAVTLTGTTAVSTTIITWENILGIEISAVTAGNITVREASADQTIVTITAGDTSAGVETPTTTNGYGLIPRHDASGASTSPIAVIGTDTANSGVSVVDALNGTTEEDHGTTAFATITKVLIGAVASSVNVTVLTNESTDSVSVGMAHQAATVAGQSIESYVKPYFF